MDKKPVKKKQIVRPDDEMTESLNRLKVPPTKEELIQAEKDYMELLEENKRLNPPSKENVAAFAQLVKDSKKPVKGESEVSPNREIKGAKNKDVFITMVKEIRIKGKDMSKVPSIAKKLMELKAKKLNNK